MNKNYQVTIRNETFDFILGGHLPDGQRKILGAVPADGRSYANFIPIEGELTECDCGDCHETIMFQVGKQKKSNYTILDEKTLPRDERPVDEIMKDFEVVENSAKKSGSKKKSKKAIPQARSKPRILRTKINRKVELNSKTVDEKSRTSNKYNKRFTKTKKPTKL